MKPFEKTKDGVIDNLLRAYVSRPINPPQSCPEFDPDLANAYIELRLPSASRSRYEDHLSECGACRMNVAALVRLADTSASVMPVRDRDRATWWSGVSRVFGALSQPQWAMATTAALVLAISVPVLLSRNADRASQRVADGINTEPQQAGNTQAASQPAPSTPAANPKAGSGESATSAAATPKKHETDTGTVSSTDSARNTGVPGAVGGAVSEAQRSEPKSLASPAEDTQRKPQSKLAEAAAQPATPTEVAKNESDEARQQKKEKDSAQPAPESRAGRVDEPRDREKSAKAEDVAPPPPSTASSSEMAKMRGGLKRPAAKLALRDSEGESVRPNARRISKKDFWFKDNTWTDKDFDPNKNLPVVTIVHDSNVYKEEIAKRAGLKPYLTGFSETERVIIVYKGKVYKLIPQR